MTQTPFSYRTDPDVPAFPDDAPIIIFDGHCALCSGWARFVLRHDRKKLYRLLPAQTPLGRALYMHYGLDPHDYETNILIADGSPGSNPRHAPHDRGARLALAARQPVPHSAERPARQSLFIHARNRLRFFGRREVCYLSAPGHEDRFLS